MESSNLSLESTEDTLRVFSRGAEGYYSQGEYIRKYLGRNSVPGLCFGLSVMWIKSHIEEKELTPVRGFSPWFLERSMLRFFRSTASRSFKNKRIGAESLLRTELGITIARNIQLSYFRAFDRIESRLPQSPEVHRDFAYRRAASVAGIMVPPSVKIAYDVTRLRDQLAGKSGHLLLSLGSQTVSHAVAFYYRTDGVRRRVRLFDPNLGEFSFGFGDMDRFFAALHAYYHIGGGVLFDKIRIYRCT